MMGNESSHLSGLEIEEKAIEVSDFWSHYQATIKDSCRYFSLKSDGSVSVFKGRPSLGPLWAISSPLEKFANNLLKYRHPCIIRYISAWQQKSTLHLATEFVQPLSHVLSSQTPLQICIGLNNVLRALVFLHDQAGMSHNNVCISSIYVTGDGQWKLGGLQYLSDFNELTPAYLKQARIHRYDKAVDPNEDSYEITSKVDQYAFATLVEDVFKGRRNEDVPHLSEFKKYCQENLQHRIVQKRPVLAEVLTHNFFNHEFITIYKFLNFLPLKTEDEKYEFFSSILDSLKCYDEETVAKQLGGLLLSRLTMLDPTARKDVIPYILKPKNERLQNAEESGFFSLSVYKEHVKPRVLQLFAVRDSQIRMMLLTHFSTFVHVFSHEELSLHILPELLLGIRDVDDALVAATLICLSELVPILGAETVIGGKRSKLFTDGRPKSKANLTARKSQDQTIFPPKKPLRDFHCSEDVFETSSRDTSAYEKPMVLNVRPSPVGGESIDEEVVLTEYNKSILADSEDEWSDWDSTNRQLTIVSDSINTNLEEQSIEIKNSEESILTSTTSNTDNNDKPSKMTMLQKAAIDAKKNIRDISELDIKNQKNEMKKSDEIDFFADMMPVIEKPTVVNLEDVPDISSKLNFVPDEGLDENEGWGDNWND